MCRIPAPKTDDSTPLEVVMLEGGEGPHWCVSRGCTEGSGLVLIFSEGYRPTRLYSLSDEQVRAALAIARRRGCAQFARGYRSLAVTLAAEVARRDERIAWEPTMRSESRPPCAG